MLLKKTLLYTDRYKEVISNAKEEAGKLVDQWIFTEHLLLALLNQKGSMAKRVLRRMRITQRYIKQSLMNQITIGSRRTGQEIETSPRLEQVIDFASKEARHLNNNFVGTEHLLLGLIREPDGLAGRILKQCGVKLEKTRKAVVAEQGHIGRAR